LIPFQRLRHVHQLALTYLVYPGTTHKRFEHSLGVMELASRVFDIVTDERNILHDSVREILPDADGKRYWRSVLRMAALCHDVGHLPFSHAAEAELLPEGFDHERLTVNLIESEQMREIWGAMRPLLNPTDITKLAVGPKKADHLEFTTWEAVLAEIITGDAFGADRMDYLLRDAYHAGVQYGNFDHHRLVNSLRILPTRHQESEEPALGLEDGGLESSEGLMLARHFMYKQVYMHPIRRVYDIHLKDFLKSWLDGGMFATDLAVHLALTVSEVLSAIGAASRWEKSPHNVFARRIQFREHFRRFYSASPTDRDGGKLIPGKAIAEAAQKEFGPDLIRYDYMPPKIPAPEFPVRRFDGAIQSSLNLSPVLKNMPPIEVDTVYCDKAVHDQAIEWRNRSKNAILNL
jgi:HD superfamily phosphohydrolase